MPLDAWWCCRSSSGWCCTPSGAFPLLSLPLFFPSRVSCLSLFGWLLLGPVKSNPSLRFPIPISRLLPSQATQVFSLPTFNPLMPPQSPSVLTYACLLVNPYCSPKHTHFSLLSFQDRLDAPLSLTAFPLRIETLTCIYLLLDPPSKSIPRKARNLFLSPVPRLNRTSLHPQPSADDFQFSKQPSQRHSPPTISGESVYRRP